MLKYSESKVVFAEFPDEVALAVNITNCPCHCIGCSSSYLAEDFGTELTPSVIDDLITKNPGITLFGIMGGDSSHDDVARIARYVHTLHPGIKVGMYSGRDWIDPKLLSCLDCYKIGRWISPELSNNGVDNWGPLSLPQSNQVYFEKSEVCGEVVWKNATYKFRTHPINDWRNAVIE